MIKARNKPDYFLFIIVLFLILFGMIALMNASAGLSQKISGHPFHFLSHQIIFGLIPGLILGFIAFKIPLSFLKKIAPILFLASLAGMILIFIPNIGLFLGGAKRWIKLGPIALQPSEFLKPIFFLYLAAWLSGLHKKTFFKSSLKFYKNKTISTNDLFVFLSLLGIIVFLSILLMFQRDLSTLVLIVTVAMLMYFLNNSPLKYLFLMFVAGGVSLFCLIKFFPFRMNRIIVFLNNETDPMGIGYQVKQALIAIGSGGILGSGAAMGFQKFSFITQPMADSIFAVWAKETGLIGGIILIFLFLVFVWRGFKIIKENKDKFAKLLTLGIISWLTIQAFINISSTIGILPLTGIPLPFISYGGSHLIAELFAIGLLLNISKH